jgi:tRNA (guanine-N7-)-methyltransferase
LELRTDSPKYFWYSLETFFALPKVEVEVRKNEALEVTSKYEARWLRQEKDIYDVYVKSSQESEVKEAIREFNFNNVKYSQDLEERLCTKPLVYDGYFVHFERLYRVSKSSLLIKCAFGSFERPEHKYVLIDENICRYFVSTPVKTGVNFLAHQKIIEQLNQI